MEGRSARGRGGGSWRRGGGSWRRGGGGGVGAGAGAGAGDSGGYGERRGRGGRGGHHRGRGKRDFHRGRGRASHGASTEFRRDQQEQNDKENSEQEMPDIYSRRKLESNWDRYEESEKEEVNEGIPVQRGTEYQVLLSSAGDSFTQFRFSEEKDWEMDSLAVSQIPAIFVDLETLAQAVQELPLHQRLNLEADLVQETTPVELPSVGLLQKVESKGRSGFNSPVPPPTVGYPGFGAKTVPGANVSSKAPSAVTAPEEDADEELDLLLDLQKPVTKLSIDDSGECETSNIAEQKSTKEASVVEEQGQERAVVDQVKTEDMIPQEADDGKHKADSVKKEMTEEDLEDWLDSMIS